MLTTVFSTGPGCYCAESPVFNQDIHPRSMRMYCIRLEAYDLPKDADDGDGITFAELFSQAEGKPRIARALLKLASAIERNRTFLEKEAAKP